MTRRLAILGLFVILSQVCTGCFWHRCGWWRWHCAPACSPCFTTPSCGPAIGCPSCYTPEPRAVNFGRTTMPPAGVPVITDPMPIYPGPSVQPIPPSGGVPNPMPPKTGN